MMAFEKPIDLPNDPLDLKPSKGKKAGSRKLPNGAKPDFGPGSDKANISDQKQNLKMPSLPNGEKPNFKGDEPEKLNKNTTNKDKKEQPKTTPVSVVPDADKQPQTKKSTKVKRYAGSSFHSSPEALALPKPSFKTSPKSRGKEATPAQHAQPIVNAPASNGNVQPGQGPVGHSSMQQMPARPVPMGGPFAYQGMPPQGPPQYPVVAHPQAMQGRFPPGQIGQPGFNYTVNPQGYINYQYPVGAMPPQPLGMSPFGYPSQFQQQQQPQAAPPHAPGGQHVAGQKITFNELMGSSK